MKKDINNNEPLYEQIKQDIRTKINTKVFAPNGKIPTEAQLMSYYDASRVTVRRSLQDLTEEGLLIKRHGIGVFVLPKKIERRVLDIVSFAKDTKSQGISVTTKIISKRVIKAKKIDVEKLEVNMDEDVILIERLRYIDEEPVMLERCYFKKEYSWLLKCSDSQLSHLNELLEKRAKVKEELIDYRIEISGALELEASMLKCRVNEPIYYIDLCTYDSSNNPLSRSEQLLVGNRFTINMTLPFKNERNSK